MLARSGTVTKGKECVIVGRSNIVGKPMMALMVQPAPNANATVTVCHSAHANLKEHTLRADILIVAAGKPKMVTGDMVKEGAVVIDVGINRIADASTKTRLSPRRRRRLRGSACARVQDHSGARRRGADDHRHAAEEHGPRGRTERAEMKRGSRRPAPPAAPLEPQLFPVSEPQRPYTQRAVTVASVAVSLPAIPGASPESALSIELLTQQARLVVEGAFPRLWIHGEITDFKPHRNGHWYFCLRGPAAQIRCVMWSRDQRAVPALPEDGMQVIALAQLTVYPARGDLQCTIFSLDSVGDGLWRKALEQATERLRVMDCSSHPASARSLGCRDEWR